MTDDDGEHERAYIKTVLDDVRQLVDKTPGLQKAVATAILVYVGWALEKNDVCAVCTLRDGLRRVGLQETCDEPDEAGNEPDDVLQ